MKNLFLYMAASLVIVSCQHADPEEKKLEDQINYENQKVSIETTEKNQPASFLNVEGTYRPTLIGKKEVLKGIITNTASVATYKNIVLDVICYNEDEQEIGRQQTTIFQSVGPNQSIEFKNKVEVPEGTSSVGLNINTAESE